MKQDWRCGFKLLSFIKNIRIFYSQEASADENHDLQKGDLRRDLLRLVKETDVKQYLNLNVILYSKQGRSQ